MCNIFGGVFIRCLKEVLLWLAARRQVLSSSLVAKSLPALCPTCFLLRPVGESTDSSRRLKHFGHLARHLDAARPQRKQRYLQRPAPVIHPALLLLLLEQTHLLLKLIKVLGDVVLPCIDKQWIAPHLDMIVNLDLLSVQLAPLVVEHPSILGILLLNRYYLRLAIGPPASSLSTTHCHRPASSSRPSLVTTLTLLKVVEVRVRVHAPRQLLILLL